MGEKRRVALVSGASRGIGRATAIRLARDFGAVAVVARSESGLAATAAEIESHGSTPLALALDLREPGSAAAAVERTISAFGRLDAVASIAGDVAQDDLFAMSDEAWSRSLELKFHAMRRLMLAAWPHLSAAGGAAVITSGTSAILPKAGFAAVGGINALILAVAKAFAERGLEQGVRVNTVLPGPVMTDRRRSMLERYAAARGLGFEAALTAFLAEAGIPRMGAPEDVAEAYAWLLSPAASWVRGAAFRIDGGELRTV